MKVVGVISSANHEGNSATLAREALRGAASLGAATTEIFLPQYRVEFCTGCLRCLAEGRCYQPDEFESLRSALIEADGIIISSPTFGAAPNARLKNLFDRLGLFERFTSSLGGKYVVAVSTASNPGAARKVAKSIARLAADGVFKRGYIVGTIGAKARPREMGVEPRTLRRAGELGKKLAREIEHGRRHPLQNLSGTLLNGLLMKPMFHKAILEHKDGMMKGVYCSLKARGLI